MIEIEYEDHETGSKSDRAAFRQMMYHASIRKWDLLVFWSLDRFTREGALATLKYLEQLGAMASGGAASPSRGSTAPGRFLMLWSAYWPAWRNRSGCGFRNGSALVSNGPE